MSGLDRKVSQLFKVLDNSRGAIQTSPFHLWLHSYFVSLSSGLVRFRYGSLASLQFRFGSLPFFLKDVLWVCTPLFWNWVQPQEKSLRPSSIRGTATRLRTQYVPAPHNAADRARHTICCCTTDATNDYYHSTGHNTDILHNTWNPAYCSAYRRGAYSSHDRT
jgi:hypothetical protein